MAGISVESGGRKVDGNVNMVPMIDLLVSMIAFLLMAAVWTQTGAIRARQPEGVTDAPNPVAPVLRVLVTPTTVSIGRDASGMTTVSASGDAALRDALREQHVADPSLRAVSIQPDSAVPYERVIRVMDAVYDVWSAEGPPPRSRDERVAVSLL